MTEFVFLVIPMLLISSMTIGGAWAAQTKTQLRVLAAESAWQLAEADSTESEVQTSITRQLGQRLGGAGFELARTDALSEVMLKLPIGRLFNSFGVTSPEFEIVSHAANEI